MSSRRRQVRMSMFALILSYLRDGVVDTSNFHTYPQSAGINSFVFNQHLYQAEVEEEAEPLLPLGVTIQFKGDKSEVIRTGAQKWDTTVCIYIRTQRAWVGESDSWEIAEKVDQALYRSAGKIEIKDYDLPVPTPSGTYLQWQVFSRGNWVFAASKLPFDQLVLEFEATYTTPGLG